MSGPVIGNPPAPGGPGLRFLGWRMVGVAFVVDFIAVGFFFYSYGVFFKAIAADLEGSRFGISMGISISNLVGAVLAPFIGRAVDRQPIKHIMIAGAFFVSAGFALMSQITAIWHYYLLLGTFMAAGMGMMGGLASSKLVANWFVARRGTALGIATMGVSLSGLVMPVVATWLVTELGWRSSFGIYALGTISVVVPLVAWLVVSRPEDAGLRPDGESPTPNPADPPAEIELVWRTRDILRSRNLWVIALPFAMTFSALSAILIHLVPYADDMGIPRYRTAWVLSVAAGTGALGKLVFGWLVDRLDPRIAVWISFASQMTGLLMIMQGGDYGDLLAGAAVFGFGMGGVIPLQGALTGTAFGRLSFGKVLGLMRPVQVPLHVLGIPLAGWIHDTTGSYDLAWRIFLGVYLAASLMIFGLRPQPAPAAKPASARETGLP